MLTYADKALIIEAYQVKRQFATYHWDVAKFFAHVQEGIKTPDLKLCSGSLKALLRLC
jgi:hypothetical protein